MYFLAAFGDSDLPIAALTQGVGQRLRRGRFSMHNKNLRGRLVKSRSPSQQGSQIGMRRKAIDRKDRCSHPNLFAEHAHSFHAIYQASTERPLSLECGNEHAAF